MLNISSLLLDEIIQEKDNAKVISDIERQILRDKKPRPWNVYRDWHVEKDMEVGFHKLILSLEENTNIVTKGMSVMKFFALKDKLQNDRPNN